MDLAALRAAVLSASEASLEVLHQPQTFGGVFSEFISQREPSRRLSSIKDNDETSTSSTESVSTVDSLVLLLRDSRNEEPLRSFLKPIWQEMLQRLESDSKTAEERCHAISVSVPRDIRLLMSLPDRLASVVTVSGRGIGAEEREQFRSSIYKVAIVAFLARDKAMTPESPAFTLLRSLIEIVVRLGQGNAFVAVIPQILREASMLNDRSIPLLTATFLSALPLRSSLDKLVSCYCCQWGLESGEWAGLSQPIVRPFIAHVLEQSFGAGSAASGMEMEDWQLCRASLIHCALRIPRGSMALYDTVFTAIEQCSFRGSEIFFEWLKSLVTSVLSDWSSSELMQRGDGKSCVTLGHMLSCFFDSFPELMKSLGPQDVQLLLNGISKRFEVTRHLSVREVAARIATQYASISLPSTDDLPQFDEFPDVVEKWRTRRFQNLSSTAGKSQIEASEISLAASSPSSPKDGRSAAIISLRCGSLADHEDETNPDEAFVMFRWLSNAAESAVVPRDISPIVAKPSALAVGLTTVPSEASPIDMKVPVYLSITDAFDALCGTRRSSETERQAQDRLEGSLRSLPTLLQQLFDDSVAPSRQPQGEKRQQQRIRSTTSAFAGMAATLLDVLAQTPLSFPPSLQLEMESHRNEVFAFAMMIAPSVVLPRVSDMVVSNRISLFLKVALLSAVQTAAERLASVPLVDAVAEPHQATQQRLYPPISRNEGTAGVVRIRSTDGHNTRRWGYASKDRSSLKPKRYRNHLADHCDVFFSCLLTEGMCKIVMESDTMPFVGAQILKTLSALFHELRNARHVVPQWCAVTVSWLLETVHVIVNGDVRGLAWMSLADALQTWRGASRSIDQDFLVMSNRAQEVALTFLTREVDVLVKRCIVRVIVLLGEMKDDPSFMPMDQ